MAWAERDQSHDKASQHRDNSGNGATASRIAIVSLIDLASATKKHSPERPHTLNLTKEVTLTKFYAAVSENVIGSCDMEIKVW